MDYLAFLGFIVLIALIIVPIIVLVKVSSIDSRLRRMEDKLSEHPSPVAPRPREAAAPQQAATVKPAPATPAPAIAATVAQPVRKTTAPAADNPAADNPAVSPTAGKPAAPQAAQAVSAEKEAAPATTEKISAATPEKASAATTAKTSPVSPGTSAAPIAKTPAQTRPASTKESKPSALKALFTENWLSKVGIITLVLGVAFFVKYAIDQNWINEIGRVGIGILAGAAILLVGHKLRKNYHLLSSLLVGGGIAVFYITIAIAFREYQLFGQTAAFSIFVGITVVAVCLSLLYNRQELALLSLLGGYASPLLASSGTGNYAVLFTFLLILNTGMLAVAMLRRWNLVGIVSYICTTLFFWGWLFTGFKDQYAGATLFAALFFVQFYLLALLEYFRDKKITAFQVVVILSNNLSLLLACTLIFKNYPLHIMGLVTMLIGVANAVVLGVLMRVRQIDRRMLYLVIAVVLSFVSLAVPVQLKGHAITMFWAAEAVILLGLWQRSRIRVFQGGFLLICGLMLISYFMDVAKTYAYDYSDGAINSILPVVFNRVFITGLVVVASLGICRWLAGRDRDYEGGLLSGNFLTRMLSLAVVIMGWLVPLFEISYQLGAQESPLWNFRFSAIGIWSMTYAAALAAVYRKELPRRQWIMWMLFGTAAMFAITVLPSLAKFRWEVYIGVDGQNTGSLFLLHYLMWPGMAYIFYALLRNLKSLPKRTMSVFAWLLTAVGVALLSTEADNTTIQLAGNAENYYTLLHDVHTFGYPILWGVVAAGLMLWGVRRREVLPRQIALVFFGLIVLKFYVFDVWRMSQAGRIISFVALGVILLGVSFLQQRIKTLVREDGKLPPAAQD